MKMVKQATKEVQRLEARIAELTGRKDELSGTLSPLQAERAAAVKAFAEGDETQETIVSKLDKQTSPIAIKIEGITELITVAEKDLAQAKTVLQEAREQRDKKVTAFVNQQEEIEKEKFLASLPRRHAAIYKAYVDLCLSLGELRLGEMAYSDRPLEGVAAFMTTMGFRMNQQLADERLVRVYADSGISPGDVWPMVRLTPDLAAALDIPPTSGGGLANAFDVARLYRVARRDAFTKEYEAAEEKG